MTNLSSSSVIDVRERSISMAAVLSCSARDFFVSASSCSLAMILSSASILSLADLLELLAISVCVFM